MASASVADPQTFNRYSYALNSPYRYADPSGMLSMDMTSAMGQFARNGEGRLLGGGGGFTGALERGGYSAGVRAQGVAEKALGALGAAAGAAAAAARAAAAGLVSAMTPSPFESAMNLAERALEIQSCQAVVGQSGLSTFRELRANNKIRMADETVMTRDNDMNPARLIDLDRDAEWLHGVIYLNPNSKLINGKVSPDNQLMLALARGLNQVETMTLLMLHEDAHATGAFPPEVWKGSTGMQSWQNSVTIKNECMAPLLQSLRGVKKQ